MKKILEIACFNPEAALIATKAGAHRIELCENYQAGGTTPSFASILEVRSKIQIPLHVIIRPRAGNFIYTPAEIHQIKESVLICKKSMVNGIVFGALTETGNIDVDLCRTILRLAGSMSLTFHRAIDECINLEEGIEELVKLGIPRVLTSGGMPKAEDGLPMLSKLQTKFGKQISIMPGGGIRASNLKKIMLDSGCSEYHSAAISNETEYPDQQEIMNLLEILES